MAIGDIIESTPNEGCTVHQRAIEPTDAVEGRGQTLGYDINDGNLKMKGLQSLRQGPSYAPVTTADIRGKNEDPMICVFHIDTLDRLSLPLLSPFARSPNP